MKVRVRRRGSKRDEKGWEARGGGRGVAERVREAWEEGEGTQILKSRGRKRAFDQNQVGKRQGITKNEK